MSLTPQGHVSGIGPFGPCITGCRLGRTCSQQAVHQMAHLGEDLGLKQPEGGIRESSTGHSPSCRVLGFVPKCQCIPTPVSEGVVDLRLDNVASVSVYICFQRGKFQSVDTIVFEAVRGNAEVRCFLALPLAASAL